VKLEWRESPAAHQPYGVVWELIDAELDFKINQWGQAPVHAMLSPIYATTLRHGERKYTGCVWRVRPPDNGLPTFEAKHFDSLTKAKAWAQALVALDPPP